jgi:hypothetical protein
MRLGRRNDGLCIGMRRPSLGELLGLAVLTKALALGEGQWPGGDVCRQDLLWGWARCPRPQSPHVDRYCGANNCLIS